MIPFGRIEGVTVRPLRQICDERGKVMHMLRSDDPHFERFGEIYFSVVFGRGERVASPYRDDAELCGAGGAHQAGLL